MAGSLEIESNKVSNKNKQNAWEMIQSHFNLLNHIMISIVAVYMTFLCYYAGNKPVSWHAWLCTIGYQLLMTQAILAFYSENLWSKRYKRDTKKTIHWIVQAVGSTSAIVGMIIEFIGRSQKGKNHIISTHSTIGLIAGIFTLIGMFNGISALWSTKLKQYIGPVYLKLMHNLNGILAFVLGMVALYFGYDKGYMVENSRAEIRMWLQVLACLTIVLSLIGAIRAAINLIRNAIN